MPSSDALFDAAFTRLSDPELSQPPSSYLRAAGKLAKDFGQSVLDAVRLPGQVAGGEFAVKPETSGMWSEEDEYRQQRAGNVIESRAKDLAGAVMGGGFRAAPAGSIGMAGSSRGAAMLPMDEASRMARAKSQGFDTDRTWYHGTKSVFDEFDIKKAGASDDGLAGKGHYFTYNPEEASSYALRETFGRTQDAAPNVVPAYLSIKNPLVITHGVLPDGSSLKDVHQGIGINSKGGDAIRGMAEKGGHDGVVFADRDGNWRHAVAFNADKIRSKFAAFDPANEGTGKLLGAGNPLSTAIQFSQGATEGKPAQDFGAQLQSELQAIMAP
jgi:hypothetical protein